MMQQTIQGVQICNMTLVNCTWKEQIFGSYHVIVIGGQFAILSWKCRIYEIVELKILGYIFLDNTR